MFTELLQAEVWRKKLESAGFRVIPEAWEQAAPEPPPRDTRERITAPPMHAPSMSPP